MTPPPPPSACGVHRATRLAFYSFRPPRNSGGIPKVSTRFSLSMEMSRLTRDGTAEPVSRDQILRRERGQGNLHVPCSADHVQDWQPYPVDLYVCVFFPFILDINFDLYTLAVCVIIHTYIFCVSWSTQMSVVGLLTDADHW